MSRVHLFNIQTTQVLFAYNEFVLRTLIRIYYRTSIMHILKTITREQVSGSNFRKLKSKM